MSTEQMPEVFVSGKAQQMAKAWVRKMGGDDSDSEVDDSPVAELEARPPRLGLGAKYLPHSQVSTTWSPVERKLRAMTNTTGKLVGSHRLGSSAAAAKAETKSDAESGDEEEVKGSSRINYGRQRRFASTELLAKGPGSKGEGVRESGR